jgi:hypothetical protein
MSDAERKLFNDMITHHIRSFSRDDEHERDYHREMYEVTKHVLWELQEEKREHDKDT